MSHNFNKSSHVIGFIVQIFLWALNTIDVANIENFIQKLIFNSLRETFKKI